VQPNGIDDRMITKSFYFIRKKPTAAVHGMLKRASPTLLIDWLVFFYYIRRSGVDPRNPFFSSDVAIFFTRPTSPDTGILVTPLRVFNYYSSVIYCNIIRFQRGFRFLHN